MATVIKRSGSPHYYAKFEYKGQRVMRTTGKRRREDAVAVMRGMLRDIRGEVDTEEALARLLDCLNNLPAEEQDKRRQEVSRRILGTQANQLQVSAAYERWLASPHRPGETKQSTLRGYEAIWKRFAQWAESADITSLHEVTAGHAELYASDLWGAAFTPSTFNQHIRFLSSLFRALENQAGLTENPWSRIPSKRKIQGEGRRDLTRSELETLLRRASGNLKVMLAIGLFTGLRLGDVVSLKWEQIDLDGRLITSRPMKTERTGKLVRVPIHPALLAILQEHRAAAAGGVFLFPLEWESHQRDSTLLSKQIQKFFESCGIATTERAGHSHRKKAIVRVGFHSLRHSFVSLSVASRVPLHVVQELVGHGSPAMTQHYVHTDPQQRSRAIAGLPNLTDSPTQDEPPKKKKEKRQPAPR